MADRHSGTTGTHEAMCVSGNLRRQLYPALCVIGFVMTVFVIVPLNALQTVSPVVDAALAAFGMLSLVLYALARRGHHLPGIHFVVLLGTIDVVFFANGGSVSSVSMYLFAPALYLVVFFGGATRWLALLAFMVNGTGLYLLEHFQPQWCVPFASEADRLLDLVSGFILGNACCIIMLWVVLAGYDEEQRRLSATVRELRESEERHRVLFDSAGDAIVVSSQSGRMLAANAAACQQYGYEEAEFLDKSIADLDTPEEANQIARRIASLMAEGTLRFRTTHRRGDGTTMPIEVSASRITWYGEPAIMSICRDASARRRDDAALRMEAIGRLAGGVAHDFNNMLAVIQGHVELALAQAEADGNDVLQEDLAHVQQAAQRSAALTRQLLAFARQQTVVPRALDLNDAVAGTLQMLCPLIGENIQVDWRPGAGLWPVRMDPAQLDQILTHLCLNARDAIAGVGRVVIETDNRTFDPPSGPSPLTPPGDYVHLAVSDDGCGMDEATMARVFEPFFSTKGLGQGSGMGLATVYGAVEQNGGATTVSSAPGRGATFDIYLPRHSAPPTPDDIPAAVAGPASPPADTLILLVEDEPAVLRMTTRQLQGLGYQVVATADTQEAVALAEQRPGAIALLITDVVMPGMNGADLANALRPSQPAMGVVFMSGYPSDVLGQHGVLADAVQFIPKPFSKADLASKVAAALGAGGA
ncbi:MAG: response regulator [Armatimonadetes bacterium]|nr:response regulator [Armatimonadota bacterium]